MFKIFISDNFTKQARRDLLLALLCCVYSLAVYLFASHLGLSHRYTLLSSSGPIAFTLGAGTICIALAFWARSERVEQPENRLTHFKAFFKTHLTQNGGAFAYVLPLVMISVLVAAFTTFKALFPQLFPFSFDHSFYVLDQKLHFGMDPWRITHAIFGSDIATYGLNWLYNMWFGFMWLSICAVLLATHNNALRQQYLLSFCLCWILIGSLGAALMSSAGPVYYGNVTGDTAVYAPLLERLQDINASLEDRFGVSMLTLEIQDMLWRVYSSNGALLGGGISAMPSMHVSIATLMALGAWRVNKKLGLALSLYAALIQIGSVHLGWHYAIDGYVSILATIAIWKFVGLAVSKKWSPEDVNLSPVVVKN
ncbi:MAG: phosphatase PAP2 family protein [Sphingomonadales bacterium]